MTGLFFTLLSRRGDERFVLESEGNRVKIYPPIYYLEKISEMVAHKLGKEKIKPIGETITVNLVEPTMVFEYED